VIKYFEDAKLLSPELAKNLQLWKHCGFRVDNSISIAALDNKAREAIAQYLARCPVSLNKIINEPFKGEVIFKTKYNNYFKENLKIYDADAAPCHPWHRGIRTSMSIRIYHQAGAYHYRG
jgi:hypothetical protein